jgi:hypothetical protein
MAAVPRVEGAETACVHRIFFKTMNLATWWASRLLRSRDPTTRCEAIERLSRQHNDHAFRLLALALSDCDATVRRKAIMAVEDSAHGGAFQTLLPTLKDRDHATRHLAEDALRRIAPEDLRRYQQEERAKERAESEVRRLERLRAAQSSSGRTGTTSRRGAKCKKGARGETSSLCPERARTAARSSNEGGRRSCKEGVRRSAGEGR